MHSPVSLVGEILAARHDHRAARASRARLHSELSSYRTSAERAELAAILARHPAEDVAALERETGWRHAA